MTTSKTATRIVSPVLAAPARVILSFDVEEHFRIEAAAGLEFDPASRARHRLRMEDATSWLLDQLAKREIRATFFIVGQIARDCPALVRAIHARGHEVASHGWDHRRLHHHTPDSFRADVARSTDALEQVTGARVVGYRAPTFSVVRATGWAVDVLAELGMEYDSSIYPVRHDRYGVPEAPRQPFLAVGSRRSLLEIPPAVLRCGRLRLPVGGGGYFRLFPLFLLEWGLAQVTRSCRPAVAMLYFHPWEFDSDQPRLPLPFLSGLRTYVGIRRTRERLASLLDRHRFVRAVDAARDLAGECLTRFDLE